jgi:hypothetical protein
MNKITPAKYIFESVEKRETKDFFFLGVNVRNFVFELCA